VEEARLEGRPSWEGLRFMESAWRGPSQIAKFGTPVTFPIFGRFLSVPWPLVGVSHPLLLNTIPHALGRNTATMRLLSVLLCLLALASACRANAPSRARSQGSFGSSSRPSTIGSDISISAVSILLPQDPNVRYRLDVFNGCFRWYVFQLNHDANSYKSVLAAWKQV
jgi:hypothetical protein